MTKTLQCALHVALFIQTQVDFELVVMCAMNGMILNVYTDVDENCIPDVYNYIVLRTLT